MNTITTRSAAVTRIAALGAAAAMTTIIFASQLGLAGHYTADADAVFAAQRTAPVALNSTAAAPAQPRS